MAPEGDQLAPDRDELAFALCREQRGAQQLAAPHRMLGDTAQVPAQGDAKVLLDLLPRFGARDVVQARKPCRSARPVIDLASEMPSQLNDVSHG